MSLKCMRPAYIPAFDPSVIVKAAMRGYPNPPKGRLVNWAQHICISPASSSTGAIGAISEIVASASNSQICTLSDSVHRTCELSLQQHNSVPSLSWIVTIAEAGVIMVN